jgi:hypothetical protein
MALIGRGNAKRLAKDGTTGRTICAARGNAAFEPRDAPQMDSGAVWTTAKVLLDTYGHWLLTGVARLRRCTLHGRKRTAGAP